MARSARIRGPGLNLHPAQYENPDAASLLAAIAAASPASAEPCSTVASRYIAETLRLAAEERPVNVLLQTRTAGVKISDHLKSRYPDELTIILQHQFKQFE